MADRLDGKVALVIGAGSIAPGMSNGRATALVFAREGARVVAADIDGESCAETVAVIEGEGGAAEALICDATDDVQIRDLVTGCVARHGRLDVLHNNVGGSIPGGAADIAPADWDANMTFNLTSAYLSCRHALPVMAEQGKGAIVNVASVAGLRFLDRPIASYQAAKAGLIQFTRAIGVEYAPKGVRANCVVPGVMATPLVAHRLVEKDDPAQVQAVIDRRNALSPMGHMGDAWDVAYAALYLASDEAKYVTATEIIVDGGLTARSG